MDLREFINEDQLNCLYCNHRCEITVSSYASSNGTMHDHVSLFKCNNCLERFQIILITSSYTNILSGSIESHLFARYSFTCKTIDVSIRNGNFFITQKNPFNTLKEVQVPPFEISFKNKEDLYIKLQTYLLFS